MFRSTILGVLIFWFMDILNMDFMKLFDTTYPLNFLFWLGIFMLMAIVSELRIPSE